MDKDRINCDKDKIKDSSKRLRKDKRQKHKRRIDAFRRKEGPTYKSGHFHIQKSQSKPKTVRIKKIHVSYTLEGNDLENVESIKYLGVTITSDLR